MCQVILNADIYTKQKINLIWLNDTTSMFDDHSFSFFFFFFQ